MTGYEKAKKKQKLKTKANVRKFNRPRTVLLHDRQELDDDLGGRTDEDLALASLLGVVHGVKRIVKDGGLDHFGGLESRFSNRNVEIKDYEVSVRRRRV